MTDDSRPSRPLQPGVQAPEFALKSTPDQTVSLAELRGNPVILAFYPADWSPVCGDQMALYNEMLGEFQRFGAHHARHLGRRRLVPRRVRAGPQAALPAARRLRAQGRGGSRATASTAPRTACRERALFVIDGDGVIRWSYVSPVGVNPGADGILAALEALPSQRRAMSTAAGPRLTPPVVRSRPRAGPR